MKKTYRIPYGISNFKTLREENYLYIDKTHYIEKLEEMTRYQFFIRPRRFGKSLFASMLEYYYDLSAAKNFNHLFNGLYAGKKPTLLKNSYCILRMSFAAIVSSESKGRLILSFDKAVEYSVKNCLIKYYNIFNKKDIPDDEKGAENALRFLFSLCNEKNKKIYLIIDEYDNFANDLIANQRDDLYYELIQSEGYIRAFYKTVKDGTHSGIIDRIYMTGVSPILLDDLTSGLNMMENLTLRPHLNEMLGITQKELVNILNQFDFEQNFNIKELMKDLKESYNGYTFSPGVNEKVYNTDMVLYFLNEILLNGYYPRNILDQNAKTDYRKLQTLAKNFDNKKILDDIMKTGRTKGTLVDRFNLKYMYNNIDNLKSFLFYLGMLTIEDEIENELVFKIPNYVVKTIYWEYFTYELRNDINPERDSLKDKVRKMRLEGDPSELMQYLNDVLKELSNRDLVQFDEKNIKMLLTSLLFIDGIYIIRSENEVTKGYADLMLTRDRRYVQYTKYEYMIEIKHIKQSEYDKNPEILERVKNQGRGQLKKYCNDRAVMFGFGSRIKMLLVVVTGKNNVYCEEVPH